jgi:hypothetical protein
VRVRPRTLGGWLVSAQLLRRRARDEDDSIERLTSRGRGTRLPREEEREARDDESRESHPLPLPATHHEQFIVVGFEQQAEVPR